MIDEFKINKRVMSVGNRFLLISVWYVFTSLISSLDTLKGRLIKSGNI